MSDRPRVGSLFAGVEGFGQGFEQAGFEVAWQVEIDKDAISVLERHYPNVPRWRDVTEVDPAELSPVDVVTFGSPCQDFSVAGKRAGMAGARSGLFGEAIRIISGLRPTPAFAIWENVPGALSGSGGRDFGAALDGLADAGALDIAWRVLDARWFGVPQRRRRIFVVADFGGERAAQVLFEPQSSSRHPAPSGAAGQRTAGDAADGAGVTGWAENYGAIREQDVAPAIRSGRGLDPSQNAGGFMVALEGITGENGHTIANSVTASAGDYAGSVSATKHDAVAKGMALRRLTPRECERLMGWPDSHTAYRADGSEIADGPRYRMIGNGVVAPVAQWLAGRIRTALEVAR